MPATCCCVPNCSVRGGHHFPGDEKLKKQWIIAIKRVHEADHSKLWNPAASSVVCKEHFVGDDYLKTNRRGITIYNLCYYYNIYTVSILLC